MLNYIRAELWKVFRRRYLWLFLLVMLALESVFALAWTGWRTLPELVELLASTMIVGAFLSIILADMVYSDQYKAGSLKNEITFGIPRARIYFGKLCAALITALFACGVILGFYLVFAWLTTSHGDWAAARESMVLLGGSVLAALPLWLACMGISMAVLFTVRNEMAAVVILFFSITLGPTVLSLLAVLTIPPLRALGELAIRLLPTAFFWNPSEGMVAEQILQNWVLGLCWFAASTAGGLALFSKRQIQ